MADTTITPQNDKDKLPPPPGVQPVAPVSTSNTPLGAALSGVNPDQAKMAGTAAQMAAAAEKLQKPQPAVAPAPTTQLGVQASSGRAYVDYLRQLRPDLAQASQPESDMAKQMALIDKVGFKQWESYDLIGKAAGTTAADSMSASTSTYTTPNADGSISLSDGTVLPNTATGMNDFVKGLIKGDSLATLAAMPPADQSALLAQVSKIAPDYAAIIEKSLAGHQVVMGDLSSALSKEVEGYDPTTLAKAMGVSVEEMNGMKVGDFYSKLETTMAEQARVVTDQQAILADPASSPAEKAAASRTLLRQGALGIRTPAQEAKDLSLDIMKREDIIIGNTTYHGVGELMADKGLSALITRALDKNGGADADAALKTCSSLGLVDLSLSQDKDGNWQKTEDGKSRPLTSDEIAKLPFINRYSNILTQLSAGASTSLSNIIAVQKDIQETTVGGAVIDPSTIEALIPSAAKGYVDPTDKDYSTFKAFVANVKASTDPNATNLMHTTMQLISGLVADGHADQARTLIQRAASMPTANLATNLLKSTNALLAADKVDESITKLEVAHPDGNYSWADINTIFAASSTLVGALNGPSDVQTSMLDLAGVSPSALVKHLKDNMGVAADFVSLQGKSPDGAALMTIPLNGFNMSDYGDVKGNVLRSVITQGATDDGYYPPDTDKKIATMTASGLYTPAELRDAQSKVYTTNALKGLKSATNMDSPTWGLKISTDVRDFDSGDDVRQAISEMQQRVNVLKDLDLKLKAAGHDSGNVLTDAMNAMNNCMDYLTKNDVAKAADDAFAAKQALAAKGVLAAQDKEIVFLPGELQFGLGE